MQVLWPHNFDPEVPNAGVFMFGAAQALSRHGLEPRLLYVGDLRSPRQLEKARSLIREEAATADLVHTQYGSALSWAGGAVSGRPMVMSLRGSDWTPAQASGLGRAHSWLSARFTRRALPRFDLVIAVSERIAGEVRTFRPSSEVVVLPDPIDLQRFVPRPRLEVRRQLGLDPTAKYVLFTTVDRENPLKRLSLAVDAIATAKSSVPELELLVAADYPHSEMPAVVAAADVALCTSVAEGWPNSVKEALACDVPVVSTDVSDLRRIAAVEPACQIVAPDPAEIAGAIVAAVTSGLTGAGLRRQVSHMDQDAYAQRLLGFYRALLRGGPT